MFVQESVKDKGEVLFLISKGQSLPPPAPDLCCAPRRALQTERKNQPEIKQDSQLHHKVEVFLIVLGGNCFIFFM